MNFYDSKRIISDSSGYQVALSLGVPMKRSGSYTFVPCPVHEEILGKPDAHLGNCWITPHGCRCGACDKSVSTVDWTMKVKGCSFPEALEFVAEINGQKEDYIDEEKTREWKEEHDEDYESVEYEKKAKAKMPKLLSYQDAKLIGLTSSSYTEGVPIRALSYNVEDLRECQVLIPYYKKVLKRQECLSKLSVEAKNKWDSLKEEEKAKTNNPNLKEVLTLEKELLSEFDTFSNKVKKLWSYNLLSKNLESFMDEVLTAATISDEEIKKQGTFTGKKFENEYLIMDTSVRDGLGILYKKYPQSYLNLVIQKAKVYLSKYQKMEEALSFSNDETNVSLFYLVRDRRKRVEAILNEHIDITEEKGSVEEKEDK